MSAVVDPHPEPTEHDHIVHMAVGWEAYQALLAWRGERPRPRLAYNDGVLELMSPSLDHEMIASMIARLLEAWAVTEDRVLNSYKSWTLKDEVRERGLEPDECFTLSLGRPTRPDIAIEVVWTRGAMNKLPIYATLGVPEVWIWQAGRITAYGLRGDDAEQRAYVPLDGSALLPDLDLDRIAALAIRQDQTAAVREFLAG